MSFATQNEPLPPPRFRSRKYPLDTLVVGEWFFVPNKRSDQIASHVSHVGKRLGKRFSVLARRMSQHGDHWRADAEGEVGVMVLRVE